MYYIPTVALLRHRVDYRDCKWNFKCLSVDRVACPIHIDVQNHEFEWVCFQNRLIFFKCKQNSTVNYLVV